MKFRASRISKSSLLVLFAGAQAAYACNSVETGGSTGANGSTTATTSTGGPTSATTSTTSTTSTTGAGGAGGAGDCAFVLAGSTKTQIANGNGELACDAAHYAGTVTYTCENGTFTAAGACACAVGYSGATCQTPGAGNSEANSFIVAAGIADATQSAAIDTLVTGLKTDDLWTKLKAAYPFVGGTQQSHKFNLKDPRDLDVAFRLVFSGGITHDANGITGNGADGWANTFIVPSVELATSGSAIGVYSRSPNNGQSTEIGVSSNSNLPILGLTTRNVNGDTFFDGYDYDTHRLVVSNPDGNGLYVGSIENATSQRLFKNNSEIGVVTAPQTLGPPDTYAIAVLARNDAGNLVNFSTRNLAFAFVSDGLSVANVANLYARVQAFQTSLSRSVM